MKKLTLLFHVSLLLMTSCNNDHDVESDYHYVRINKKTGELFIDIDSVNVKKIVIDSKKRMTSQVVRLNDTHTIERIENVMKFVNGQKNYLNTVVSLDKQGNFDYYSSYYYISAPYQDENNNVFVSCVLDRSMFDDDIFAIVGDFDDNFVSKRDVDTIFFDQKREGFIPVKNPRKGSNNIKFKIIDQTNKRDTIHQRVIYVNKDFYIK